jgi:type I restriction enzyme, R subunit
VDGYDAEPCNGVTDYCLYQPNGEVINVVEAKRQSCDPCISQSHVQHYITEMRQSLALTHFLCQMIP